MGGEIDARMKERGIELPNAAAPAANYVPWVISGKLVYVSGQVPTRDGELQYIGKLGQEFSVEDGQAAARLCALNLVAQLRGACDDLDKVARCVKLGSFVNSTPDFTDQPKVVNGASDLMAEIFGDKGRHARFAVGVAALPMGVAVEIDGIFELS